MNRKCVLTDGSMLHQKALSIQEHISKGPSEISDNKLFTARKGQLHRFGNGFGPKNITITERLYFPMKMPLPPLWQSQRGLRFSTTCGFRQPLEVVERMPMGKVDYAITFLRILQDP